MKADAIAAHGRMPANRYGIYRAKTTRRLADGGCSWAWRVMITRAGKSICNKSFADKKYGGEETALLAAMAHRDQLLANAPPPRKRDRNQLLRRNNTSGRAGVSRCVCKGRLYYIAQTLLSDGTRLRRAFSVAKYGEENARELAAAERERQLTRVVGYAAYRLGARLP